MLNMDKKVIIDQVLDNLGESGTYLEFGGRVSLKQGILLPLKQKGIR